jgi:hypothetical protein
VPTVDERASTQSLASPPPAAAGPAVEDSLCGTRDSSAAETNDYCSGALQTPLPTTNRFYVEVRLIWNGTAPAEHTLPLESCRIDNWRASRRMQVRGEMKHVCVTSRLQHWQPDRVAVGELLPADELR